MQRLIRTIIAVTVGLGSLDAAAQAPSGVPRIGYLEVGGTPEWAEGFMRGLSDLGYVENRSIIVERRSAEEKTERFPELAAELVRLQPRVIVASSPPAVAAAKNATLTIPIVMAFGNDPVALGVVESLARPGGNVTGLSNLAADLVGKRLELLADTVPGLTRVGVIWEPINESTKRNFRELQVAAAALRLTVETFEVTRSEDFDAAFEAAAARAGGAIVFGSPRAATHREVIAAAAARHKMPTIYFEAEYTKAGGLLSYGPNYVDLHRRAALFVDKILKGAKPADLPVEQPTKFELVINLKTAKALGITIPQSILLRADEVID